MITGVHAILYAPDADEVRRFFREEIGYDFVDAGGGWQIFALPPAELAAHPTDGPPSQELYLMCDDLDPTIADLKGKGVEVIEPPSDQRWGIVCRIRIPGGAEVGLYEPRHPIPPTRR
jgi:predicted enzyme related to lactoylglutathione lyase